MRYRCGKALRKRDNIDVDAVAGVPDSGIAHAIGYANERICERSYLQMIAFLEYFGMID